MFPRKGAIQTKEQVKTCHEFELYLQPFFVIFPFPLVTGDPIRRPSYYTVFNSEEGVGLHIRKRAFIFDICIDGNSQTKNGSIYIAG